ncbi:pyridoxamine 5'-phosphate oxidase family protein [Aquimarina sp. ERC-38]|uniref:pyridoxamine 5'-phosphate oxidase family protein n=1 Tax=Aquimarina sp. ERC-38 TaxID=2949996 RepID=UPI002247F54D|nr:pyridoxamine 5'-phosphate oxidase family protein [Aquimarina sp. ERC-38]UZO80201.1 pyridoxamine 5'-phosphate oxidase family protein [Aquimarina sp. ERC-38]
MSVQNLKDEEAWKKLEELAKDIDFAMMETNLGGRPSHIIPMSTKEVDQEGSIWFLSNRNSEHNAHIHSDNDIQLIYSKPGAMEYMVVYGKAFIYTDQETIARFYEQSDEAWFDGVNDPNASAIKVVPEKANYWDTEGGKLASLVKKGIGAITGNKQDVGVEGELQI